MTLTSTDHPPDDEPLRFDGHLFDALPASVVTMHLADLSQLGVRALAHALGGLPSLVSVCIERSRFVDDGLLAGLGGCLKLEVLKLVKMEGTKVRSLALKLRNLERWCCTGHRQGHRRFTAVCHSASSGAGRLPRCATAVALDCAIGSNAAQVGCRGSAGAKSRPSAWKRSASPSARTVSITGALSCISVLANTNSSGTQLGRPSPRLAS